jgi:hypothetical protein
VNEEIFQVRGPYVRGVRGENGARRVGPSVALGGHLIRMRVRRATYSPRSSQGKAVGPRGNGLCAAAPTSTLCA